MPDKEAAQPVNRMVPLPLSTIPGNTYGEEGERTVCVWKFNITITKKKCQKGEWKVKYEPVEHSGKLRRKKRLGIFEKNRYECRRNLKGHRIATELVGKRCTPKPPQNLMRERLRMLLSRSVYRSNRFESQTPALSPPSLFRRQISIISL